MVSGICAAWANGISIDSNSTAKYFMATLPRLRIALPAHEAVLACVAYALRAQQDRPSTSAGAGSRSTKRDSSGSAAQVRQGDAGNIAMCTQNKGQPEGCP